MKVLKIVFLLIIIATVYAFADEHKYENITVGLEITKPSKWTFMSAEENFRNLKKIKLKDAEFEKLMLKYTTAPLVILTKYPEPYNDLNPSIKIKLKPLGRLKGIDAKKIISLFLHQFERMFQDYKLIQEPVDTTISGFSASYIRINYTLQIPDGRKFPTTSELWIVPRGNYFFIIGAGTRTDEKTGSRKEIQRILKTLKISS